MRKPVMALSRCAVKVNIYTVHMTFDGLKLKVLLLHKMS